MIVVLDVSCNIISYCVGHIVAGVEEAGALLKLRTLADEVDVRIALLRLAVVRKSLVDCVVRRAYSSRANVLCGPFACFLRHIFNCLCPNHLAWEQINIQKSDSSTHSYKYAVARGCRLRRPHGSSPRVITYLLT